jgi:hypothetical protein
MPYEKESLTIRPEKPPIGVTPRFVHDRQRLQEIKNAVSAYMETGFPIPVEWIKEYNELSQTMKKGRGVN